ncbi:MULTISPECIES: HNH endonuclease signature motif containing protein [Enterobacter]|uniref:HNH endonuclease n=1 Tax=Enterobacter TaxID=547 RepID=UPI0028E9B261|nr:HNH endonuclease signature motif containing protein [Enterobacter cloacae]WNT37857.1 HNH endonuclease signature motif containing protein [Enterobacter cloacae]
MVQQAWSFKAIEKDDLRYWGNDGYHDDSSVFYRYNNSVPNYKNVKKGDIVIIRDREKVLGISIVEKLETRSTTKTVFKCPHEGCNAKKIRPRETIKPKWRCDNGHEFAEQKIVLEPATEFIANYGSSFQTLDNVSLLQLKSESPRYNIQLSIQEVNIKWAQELLGTQTSTMFPLTAGEADNDTPNLLEDDQRKIVDRQIKQRRGQKTFRDKLLKFNPVCAVTGCELVDILEAAHIDAYRNDSHNDISNGLLLRTDIHTLFDLELFAINPMTHQLHFSDVALNNGYKELENKKISVKHPLSKQALNKRWNRIKNRDH